MYIGLVYPMVVFFKDDRNDANIVLPVQLCKSNAKLSTS